MNGGNDESSGSMFSITPMSTKMMLRGGDVYEGGIESFYAGEYGRGFSL